MKNTTLIWICLIQCIAFVTQSCTQVKGNYDNEEIFINGLSIKPGRHIPEEELKTVLEINPNRTDWGIGIDWNKVEIDSEEDEYQGTLVTEYDYEYLNGKGFIIDVAGRINGYGYVPNFSLQSPDIVIGFLGHKFIIGTTKKEEVGGLFYNDRVEETYPNGYSDIKVFTHGGRLYFDFDLNDILQSIYLESW